MPLNLNEALEWLDRPEQAREVAGQLTDPGAEQAVLNLAESYGGWRELPSSPLAPQTGAGKAAPRMELVISLALPPNRQYGMEEIGGCLNIEAY